MVVLDIRTLGTVVLRTFKIQGCDPESGVCSDPVFEMWSDPDPVIKTTVGS